MTVRALVRIGVFCTLLAGYFAGWMALAGIVTPAAAVEVRIGIVRVDYPELVPISRYDRKPDDLGFAGGKLGDEDNQTTGSFLGHQYSTVTVATPPEDVEAATRKLTGEGIRYLVVLGHGEDVLRVADAAGTGCTGVQRECSGTRVCVTADCRGEPVSCGAEPGDAG